MPYVSLIVEALRARPVGVFWFVVLAQALLWVLVPVLFYSSPPGDLPEVLAIGREWQPGSWRGPPLAFWLAELAFNAAGGRPVGVYVLSQICVVAAFWTIFAWARALVGTQYAVLAVLLMNGIVALSAPTPDFGPAVLAMLLTALALVFFWRALGEGRRGYWVALAFTLGLLLLTTYWGLLIIALMALFMTVGREGRAALATIDPWAAAALALVIALPHAGWLWQSGVSPAASLPAFALSAIGARFLQWPLLLGGLIAAHAGLIVLAVLASGWRADSRLEVPEIEGQPVSPFARAFVLFFAAALPLAGALVAALVGADVSLSWAAPLVLFSGLAVLVAAGRRLTLHRQHIVGVAWLAVLTLPPAAVFAAIALAPWTAVVDLSSRQPTAAMGHFFTDTFRRRTGRPLEIVVGDSRYAQLIALGSADRPHVYSAADSRRTPWLSDSDVRRKGGVIVWPVQELAGQPPPEIRARFPDLVAELPQNFERPLNGFLPALRIGWGLLRPQSDEVRPAPRRP